MQKCDGRQSEHSGLSSISTAEIRNILEQLRWERHRNSTRDNYYCVWKLFNNFYIKLDSKPKTWEDRIILFAGYLIQSKKNSTTVRSYVSAIKAVLANTGYDVCEDKVLLRSITRACKLKYDRASNKLPIRKRVVNMLLKGMDTFYDTPQPYLVSLYKALITTAYYGMLRIGEITKSPHVIKSKNVQIGTNKHKLLFILNSSKTHGEDEPPQYVKITAQSNRRADDKISNLCPFRILGDYLKRRKPQKSNNEQFSCLLTGHQSSRLNLGPC